jgi:hypothetical protein
MSSAAPVTKPRSNSGANSSSAPSASRFARSTPAQPRAPRRDNDVEDTLRPDETRLLIDWHHVGAIIGKAGATVKQIRDESGASINILAPSQSVPPPQQVDRIVSIRGNTQQSAKAIKEIASSFVHMHMITHLYACILYKPSSFAPRTPFTHHLRLFT